MGGMWSLKLLTEVMIFMTVVRRVVSMALRTFARSVFFLCVSNPCSFLATDRQIMCPCACVRNGLTTLRPRLRDRDPDGPALPADLLVALVPHLAPARLLHELDRHLAAAAAVCAVPTTSTTSSSSSSAPSAPGDATGRAEEAPHDGAGLLLQGRGGGALLGLVGVELAQEGGGALGDEGLELGLGDVGEGEV